MELNDLQKVIVETEEPKVVEHPAPTQVKVVQKKRKRGRPRKNKQNN